MFKLAGLPILLLAAACIVAVPVTGPVPDAQWKSFVDRLISVGARDALITNVEGDRQFATSQGVDNKVSIAEVEALTAWLNGELPPSSSSIQVAGVEHNVLDHDRAQRWVDLKNGETGAHVLVYGTNTAMIFGFGKMKTMAGWPQVVVAEREIAEELRDQGL